MTNFEPSNNINQNIKDHILELEIDRRDKKNALTDAMYQTLSRALSDAKSNSDIRVIFIHGQSDLFTSGNDLKDFMELDLSKGSAVVDFLHMISRYSKPMIAAVGGPAIGIGTTLLLHCDMVLASEDAIFQMPFVNLGVCPEGASSFLLQQSAGQKLSNELLLLGEAFNSHIAKQAGLINHIYPPSEIISQGWELCKKIASKPQDSIKTTKRLIKANQSDQIQRVIENEFEQFARLLQTPAAKEIMTAILEKRAPNMSTYHST
jgi:enoyl-CoA hydratase/carnithine racemase